MGGQLTRTAGATGFHGRGISRYVEDAVDAQAKTLESLIHYIDPADMNGEDALSYCRATGARIAHPVGAPMTLGTVSGRWNGRTVMKFDGTAARGVEIEAQRANPTFAVDSFTYVAAIDIAATLRSDTDGPGAQVFGMYLPGTGTNASPFLLCPADGTYGLSAGSKLGSGGVNLALASTPAADTEFIVAVSYDASDYTIKMYIDDTASAVAQDTGSAGTNASADDRAFMQTGFRLGSTDYTWNGNIGKNLWIGEAMHATSGKLAELDDLMAAMRSYYAIS
ncbi:hypothetical protein [uncultured Sulfitobacter sp.]|uniref:hypothetical protein n=1 Tax=uncultured Sulfitobacter sp. TaxID=191468 RepID=UPI0025969A12|nr:hypothetical protein [uncultured Sulfitobacter sp.]